MLTIILFPQQQSEGLNPKSSIGHNCDAKLNSSSIY